MRFCAALFADAAPTADDMGHRGGDGWRWGSGSCWRWLWGRLFTRTLDRGRRCRAVDTENDGSERTLRKEAPKGSAAHPPVQPRGDRKVVEAGIHGQPSLGNKPMMQALAYGLQAARRSAPSRANATPCARVIEHALDPLIRAVAAQVRDAEGEAQPDSTPLPSAVQSALLVDEHACPREIVDHVREAEAERGAESGGEVRCWSEVPVLPPE